MRFFFQVETKEKGKEVWKERREERGGEGEGEGEEGLHSPNSPSMNLEEEEEDPFVEASRLFLREFHSKKEALFSDSTHYSLSKEESLSPL